MEWDQISVVEVIQDDQVIVCDDMKMNTMRSTLHNLDSIEWDLLVRSGEDYLCVNFNPFGNDTLRFSVPILFPNTQAICRLDDAYWVTNNQNGKKIILLDKQNNFDVKVTADTREGQYLFTICNMSVNMTIAGKSLNFLVSTKMLFE